MFRGEHRLPYQRFALVNATLFPFSVILNFKRVVAGRIRPAPSVHAFASVRRNFLLLWMDVNALPTFLQPNTDSQGDPFRSSVPASTVNTVLLRDLPSVLASCIVHLSGDDFPFSLCCALAGMAGRSGMGWGGDRICARRSGRTTKKRKMAPTTAPKSQTGRGRKEKEIRCSGKEWSGKEWKEVECDAVVNVVVFPFPNLPNLPHLPDLPHITARHVLYTLFYFFSLAGALRGSDDVTRPTTTTTTKSTHTNKLQVSTTPAVRILEGKGLGAVKSRSVRGARG